MILVGCGPVLRTLPRARAGEGEVKMAKGMSPMRAKAAAARARTYSPREAMKYRACGCDRVAGAPPMWLLDRLADEKLTGGFKVGRKVDDPTGRFKVGANVCPRCYQARSVNGSCNCR